jgi:hypothetical protein
MLCDVTCAKHTGRRTYDSRRDAHFEKDDVLSKLLADCRRSFIELLVNRPSGKALSKLGRFSYGRLKMNERNYFQQYHN